MYQNSKGSGLSERKKRAERRAARRLDLAAQFPEQWAILRNPDGRLVAIERAFMDAISDANIRAAELGLAF
jgi:hypothetical protein